MTRTVLFLPAAVAALTAILNGQPPEIRPFGKYLVSVCALPSNAPAVCGVPGAPTVTINQNTPQTITIKQVGCAASTTPCPDPSYPPKVGDKFWVQATSDSGLTAAQDVAPGAVNASATGPAVGGVREYQVISPGNIVILANSPASGNFADAAPVTLTLSAVPAAAAAGGDDPTCKGLFAASAAAVVKHLDATGMIGLIGSPTPYVLAAQGKNAIFIYSTRLPAVPADPLEKATLDSIVAQIQSLSTIAPDALGVTPAAKPFQVELSITHAAALGDPAARISALNYSQFTVKDIGSDRVSVTATAQPACTDWTAFLTAVRHLEWQVTPEPSEMKLYYLSSTDAAAAFTSLGGIGSSTTAAATPAATNPASSSTPAGAAGNATISVTQPPGSFFDIRTDTTPCVFAGLAMGNSSACAGSSTTPSASASSGGAGSSASPAVGVAKAQPIGMAAMGVAAGTVEQNPSDLLVFSDATPGDDAQLLERKRILALLDLPRPEMLINAWVMQNSTANPTAMGKFNDAVKSLVTQYNESVENVALWGWGSVRLRIQRGNYFDEDFYHYIADHYVADTYSSTKAKAPQDAAQSFLDNSTAGLADADATKVELFGICKKGKYCLGYDSLFRPLKPHLTDFLLTLIAAKDPQGQLLGAINDVEYSDYPPQGKALCPGEENKDTEAIEPPPCRHEHEDPTLTETLACGSIPDREGRDRCRTIWSNLGLDKSSTPRSCATTDFQAIFRSFRDSKKKKPDEFKAPRVHLDCLRDAANRYLHKGGGDLMKADLADFLFNYKMSQQYPHEFIPYDLSQSADALNSALAPVIDAFNRDIIAYQTFMRADLQYQVDRLNNNSDQRCCVKRLFGIDKPFFFDDGLVSVRTISGQPTSINTTSQSFLDASSAPTLANLANNIASAGAGSGSGTSPLAAVLGSKQPSASLLTGVLNSYQTTYAQIGRMLNLQVTPRSLSTASSAEISVALTADETAGGTTYSGGPQGASAPNTSRVANFDTTTRIRVESVKLFEFASFSAVVERSRQKFPLLPPFVEIPYIGTLIGVPITGAKEYHSSMAVMSAMVVPTAADIAYGLRFTMDQVLDGADGGVTSCSYLTSPISGSAGPGVTAPCKFKRAVSIRDLRAPVNRFHRAMIRCFATGMATPYSSFGSLSAVSPAANADSACKQLTFDRVAQDSN
jgi:hypothetical protein